MFSEAQPEEELRVICAWCRRFLRGALRGARISHGICATCARKVYRDYHRRQHSEDLSQLWIDLGGEG